MQEGGSEIKQLGLLPGLAGYGGLPASGPPERGLGTCALPGTPPPRPTANGAPKHKLVFEGLLARRALTLCGCLARFGRW